MTSLIQSLFQWIKKVFSASTLTGRGKMVFSLGMIGLLAGILLVDRTLIQISMTFIILLIISKPIAYFNMHNVKYRRNMPDSLYKGEAFDLAMRMVNMQAFPDSFDLELNEPVTWRIGRKNILFPTVMAGRVNEQRERTRINRRGIFGRFEYAIQSCFPLGFVRNSQKGVIKETVIVYPAPRIPPAIESMLDTTFGSGLFQHVPTSDVSGEFRSIRDYLVGDHMKLISWPVSTRLQRFIIKEMEEPGPHEISIIFHSLNAESRVLNPKSFERALQLLAGLFLYFHKKHITFNFTASFNSWKTMTVTADKKELQTALRQLASATPANETDPEPLKEAVCREGRNASYIIIVSNAAVKTWQDFIEQCTVPTICLDHGDAGKKA